MSLVSRLNRFSSITFKVNFPLARRDRFFRLFSILSNSACRCEDKLLKLDKIKGLYAKKDAMQIREEVVCAQIKERAFSCAKCESASAITCFFNAGQSLAVSTLYIKQEKAMQLNFDSLDKTKAALVKKWLDQDYIAKYWYGVGLQNTLKTIDRFVEGKESLFNLWLAKHGPTPFGFIITSPIDTTAEHSAFGRFCNSHTIAITLDLLIGDCAYLGQGFSVPMIQQFLIQKCSTVTDVFIDPSLPNSLAIHVYKKAGFKSLETFIPNWCSSTHLLMRLKMQELVKSLKDRHVVT